MKKLLTLVAAALMLAGCNTIQAVDPSKPADVGDGVYVSPQIPWGRVGSGSEQFWTVDGIGLDELHFYTGIENGKALLDVWSRDTRAELGLYKADMLPNDVMDLIVRSLGKLGYGNVHASNLTPVPFGTATGFRFDLTLSSPSDLRLKGMALASQRNSRLDVILFLAPEEYYFGQRQAVVDQVFKSITLGGN